MKEKIKKERRNKNMKGKRGITLIALIITIIVMLILVAVTINIAINGGLFGTAKKAVRKTDLAKLQEEWMMTKYADYNTTTGRTNVSDGTLESVFGDKYEQYNDQFAIEDGELVYIGTDETMEQYATELGIVVYVPPLWNEAKGCNAPKLMRGMTAKKWDSTTNDWVTVENPTSDTSWYNYNSTDKQWANAQTVDGSMWVWIPRFAYMIPSITDDNVTKGYHTNNAVSIQVKFLKNTESTDTVAYTADTTENFTKFPEGYVLHPAFKFGDVELEGIWVAKFEASRSDATADSAGVATTMKIQPGVTSWRNIAVNDIFNKCKDAKYGGTVDLGSHMMKNSEWGAVAYLTHSQYGKNATVTVNRNSSYITGGGAEDSNNYKTNTAQSTTGNVRGIYDMSGGANEYVAAYVANGDTSLVSYGNSLVQADAKYKDEYAKGSPDDLGNNYAANSSKYGDAIYETSRYSVGHIDPISVWNLVSSTFPRTSNPFFTRGGYCDDGTYAGLFYFSSNHGNASDSNSFRPVLLAL